MRQFERAHMTDCKDLFLLNGLSNCERERAVAEFPEPKFFSKGERIYDREHFSRAIGYIASGSVSASDGGAGEVVMKRFCAGQTFGAAAVFGADGSYISSVTAVSDCGIVFITEDILRRLFAEYPVTAVNYITFLSEKIRFLNKKLSVIACPSAEETLFRYLCSAADESGAAEAPKSMTLLARLTGLSRATLYRSLSSLEESGRIVRENNIIRVNKK